MDEREVVVVDTISKYSNEFTLWLSQCMVEATQKMQQTTGQSYVLARFQLEQLKEVRDFYYDWRRRNDPYG